MDITTCLPHVKPVYSTFATKWEFVEMGIWRKKFARFLAKKWEFEEMGILPSVLHADPEWESDWPRVYASRLKKTVCSVLEKILSGREQITISDSLRTDLKPAAYLNLNFSNVQIWRKPNDGLVYGQTDPIVSPMRIICFLRLVIRQWTWIPGQCVVWSVCELFCKKCIYCR